MTTIEVRLDALLAPFDRSDQPGLVAAVSLRDQPLYRRAVGLASYDLAVPMRLDHRLRIGSSSKPMTAVLALRLAEAGRLDLDAPIRAYLPELTGPGGEPSLRLLLQHRGGSRCYLDLGYLGHGRAIPPAGWALATQARQAGRNFDPGEAMIYNNGGFHLASIAIARAGGAPFEALLRTLVFEPLGMSASALAPSDLLLTPDLATLHARDAEGVWRRGIFPSQELLGEGGVVSTAEDLLRWLATLRRRDRLLSSESWATLLQRPQFPDGSPGDYTLGLFRQSWRGVEILHHAGGLMGGASQTITFPDHGLDIAVVSNGAPGADPVRLAEQIAEIVLAEHLGPPEPSVEAAPHAHLLGDWASEETGLVYRLLDAGGALKLSVCGSPILIPLRPQSAKVAISPQGSLGPISVTLVPDGEGRIMIGFGGQTHAYRQPSERCDTEARFLQRAEGLYHAPDADCRARLTATPDGIEARFQDGVGATVAHVTPLSETQALTSPLRPFEHNWAALTLSPGGQRAGAFRLNAPRIRDLVFRRHDGAHPKDPANDA